MRRERPIPSVGAARVEFDGVRFRFPAANEVSVASLESGGPVLSSDPSAEVLRGITFTAAPGTMTAVVGHSGAGKTTLAALVSRLYDVTAGAVRVDGVDVREATLASLSARIGVVSQDAHLFHASIRDGLPMHPNFDDAVAVQSALDAARRSNEAGMRMSVDIPAAVTA